MKEGTLRELKAKPGDVVEFVRQTTGIKDFSHCVGKRFKINKNGYAEKLEENGVPYTLYNSHIWKVVSTNHPQPGDVVEFTGASSRAKSGQLGVVMVTRDVLSNNSFFKVDDWKVVAKPWGRLTEEEQGALLLAEFKGQEFQEFCKGAWRDKAKNDWRGGLCYRKKPKEKTFWYNGLFVGSYKIAGATHKITIDGENISMERI